MKTIRMEDILYLYKKCGADPEMDERNMRRTINLGTMNNKLNTGKENSKQTFDKVASVYNK